VDHSKWAITNVAAADNTYQWACFGDLNRADTQSARGGMAGCIQDQRLWLMLRSLIFLVESTMHRFPTRTMSAQIDSAILALAADGSFVAQTDLTANLITGLVSQANYPVPALGEWTNQKLHDLYRISDARFKLRQYSRLLDFQKELNANHALFVAKLPSALADANTRQAFLDKWSAAKQLYAVVRVDFAAMPVSSEGTPEAAALNACVSKCATNTRNCIRNCDPDITDITAADPGQESFADLQIAMAWLEAKIASTWESFSVDVTVR